ncbi:MAG: tRNA 2-thiocytidine(32) synthetase TtcA [Desulfobacterales bacterium]|nr:tRNA 2-thiocytidine(32) synthetase TtcA [Desulfobacterales bacterium]
MRTSGHAYKALNRAIGKAIHDYDMIRDGDRILVGLSGGADSLTLLWMLAERARRASASRYHLEAVYIDPGFGGGAGEALQPFCERLECPAAGGSRPTTASSATARPNRENPCFLCARLRRKRLFEIADGAGLPHARAGAQQGRRDRDPVSEHLLCRGDQHHATGPGPVQRAVHGHPAAGLCGRGPHPALRARDRQLPVSANPCPSAGALPAGGRSNSCCSELYRSNRKIKGNIFHVHAPREDRSTC